MLFYHCFYSFLFMNLSQLITGFTICIYWRENLTFIFYHTSYYTCFTNYYISHIHFYSNQYYKKKTSISQPKQNIKSITISFPQSYIQKDYYQFSSNKRNHSKRIIIFFPKTNTIYYINKEKYRIFHLSYE